MYVRAALPPLEKSDMRCYVRLSNIAQEGDHELKECNNTRHLVGRHVSISSVYVGAALPPLAKSDRRCYRLRR